MILAKIVEKKRDEIEAAKKRVGLAELKEKVKGVFVSSAFRRNISRKGHINLIAEIKRSSPSRGVIAHDFDPVQIAWKYQVAGASAISVLTDERFFDGKLEYIRLVKERVNIPVLRKDFVIDEYQVYETIAAGADALLLITRLLTQEELSDYLLLAKTYGLECLVEVHNEEEIARAVKAHASIIGINNRDLSTFGVDFSTTEKLIRLIPENKVIVSESGIESFEQVMFLKSLGVNAVLVGETLLRAKSIVDKVREIMGE